MTMLDMMSFPGAACHKQQSKLGAHIQSKGDGPMNARKIYRNSVKF